MFTAIARGLGRLPVCGLALMALLMFTRGTTPAAPPPEAEVSARVDSSRITIGDRFAYILSATYPEGWEVDLPSVLGNLAAFEVKDYEVGPPVKSKDARGVRALNRTWRFTLSTFTVDDYTLPPQEARFTRPGDSSAAFTLYTQPIRIQVLRSTSETVKDIADIEDLVPMPAPVPWGIWALGALIVLGLGLWGFLRLRARHAIRKAAAVYIPPDAEALGALEKLEAEARAKAGPETDRRLAFGLSEVFRRYVTRRFGVDALESTTSEFLSKLAGIDLHPGAREWAEAFCIETDPVKFAGQTLVPGRALRLAEGVRNFVHNTTPPAATPAEETSK